jgi:hypothetical protein
MPSVGEVWVRKKGRVALVRKIVSIEDDRASYLILHPPVNFSKGRKAHGRCRVRTFVRDSRRINEMADYSMLDGATIWRNYRILSTSGRPLFACNENKANRYLRKGYVRPVEGLPDTLQFVTDVAEKTLRRLYGDALDGSEFSSLLMFPKNCRCCCCGRASRLTQHHVVPQRHKKKLPLDLRKHISNILFLCMECHDRIEKACEGWEPDTGGDWKAYARAWKDRLVEVLSPAFLPPGWDIFTPWKGEPCPTPTSSSSVPTATPRTGSA